MVLSFLNTHVCLLFSGVSTFPIFPITPPFCFIAVFPTYPLSLHLCLLSLPSPILLILSFSFQIWKSVFIKRWWIWQMRKWRLNSQAGTPFCSLPERLSRDPVSTGISRYPPSGLRGLIKADLMCAQKTARVVLWNPTGCIWWPLSYLSKPSPPSLVFRNCCAESQGGEWATRRIWQLVNLSSRISQATVWALSTWPASHQHRLPGCLFCPHLGARANALPSASANFAPVLEEGKKGEEEDQRKIERRRSCKKSYLLHKASPAPSSPWLHSLLKASRTFSDHPSHLPSMYIFVTLWCEWNLSQLHRAILQTWCIMMHYLFLWPHTSCSDRWLRTTCQLGHYLLWQC